MPKVFPLSRYPTQYGELMMRAAMHSEPISIACGSATKALGLRGKLYSFRSACEKDSANALEMGIDVGMIGLVLLQVDKEAGTLILSNRNYCPESKLIDEVLAGLSKVEAPTSEEAPDPAKFLKALNQEKYK